MAQVVLLRGVNVGGNKTFRPSVLSKELGKLDVVNIGAAGTFVVRKPIPTEKLRSELLRRLPFETEVIICEGRDFLALTSSDPFSGEPARPDVVRFVSVLAQTHKKPPPIPINLPAEGEWLLKIISTQKRFLCGVYKRNMKAIGCLAQVEKLFGMPTTTRNWNTIGAIVKVLNQQIVQTRRDK